MAAQPEPAATNPHASSRLSDEQLGCCLASGEAAAFDELYRRYARGLSGYGAAILGDGGAGEDVAHAALLKAYQALRRGETPEHLRPWLYRIAQRVALDTIRRRRELPGAPAAEPQAADTNAEALLRAEILGAVEQLPERQRRVFLLREVNGLRVSEIAETLALGTTQVEQALFAARNRLAELLVFGERLDCEAVRRLSGGQLDSDEKRALRAHLRACPGCRNEARRRGALVLFPFLPVNGLRRVGRQLARWSTGKLAAAGAAAALVVGLPAAAFEPARAGGRPRPAPVFAHQSRVEAPARAAVPTGAHAPRPPARGSQLAGSPSRASRSGGAARIGAWGATAKRLRHTVPASGGAAGAPAAETPEPPENETEAGG